MDGPGGVSEIPLSAAVVICGVLAIAAYIYLISIKNGGIH
jgi:hypothetical protein